MLAFANTHVDGGGRPERFVDADALRGWLREVDWLGAAPDERAVTDADASEARQLRDAMVTVLLSHSDDPSADGAAVEQADALLLRAAQRYPVAAHVDHAGARLRSTSPGLPGALGSVIAAAAELGLAGDWPRLKACRNEPCHFAFFDKTRNTSAGYCSPQCASQASMRAYRARKKAAKASRGEQD